LSQHQREAGKISSAVVETIKDKIKKLEENSEEETILFDRKRNPIIIENRPNIYLMLSLDLSQDVLGSFIVFGKEYF